jgi:mycothiol synthase
VIGSSVHLAEGPLGPGQSAPVLELAAAAQAADGTAPLSEHVLLHVRHASDESPREGRESRDLLLTVDAADGPVAGYAHLDAPDEEAQSGDMSGELVVHPAYRRRGYGSALVAALLAGAHDHGVRLWAHGDLPAAASLARAAGFIRFRALWQMRMSLAGAGGTEGGGGAAGAGDAALPGPVLPGPVLPGPVLPGAVLPAGVSLRTFRPGADEESWLEVNRRAFAHHPEQGSWTREDLELRKAEPWFDPAGFFLAEKDGRVVGFHWTKVHPADGESPPIGEVYVVGVDPGQQGSGLGRALTLAGLAYLRGRGLGQVMLYADESNTPAIKMYTSLGFGQWGTDVMYRHA